MGIATGRRYLARWGYNVRRRSQYPHCTVTECEISHNVFQERSLSSSDDQTPMNMDEPADVAGNPFWRRQDYVPWAQDRVTRTESSTCSHCDITYHGSNREAFLVRYKIAKYVDRFTELPELDYTGRLSVDSRTGFKVWDDGCCHTCGMIFTGFYWELHCARHIEAEHK